MATEYGVNVSNKFAFLDDEDVDPSELIARATREKKERQKQAKAAKNAPPPPPAAPAKSPQATNRSSKENNENRRPAPRSGPRGPRVAREGGNDLSERFEEKRAPREFVNRGPRREGGGPRPRRNGDFKPRAEGDPSTDDAADGGQPRERRVRRDRDEQRPRGPRAPRPDRVSGSDKTGVRSVAKKDGHGKGNWGDDNDELQGETDPSVQQESTDKGEESGNVQDVEKLDTEESAQPEEEPEPPKRTLSEFKAQQALQKPEFKTRQANEGADKKNLAKFVPLVKEDSEEEKDDAKDVDDEKEQYSKRQQHQKVVDIHVNFNGPNRRERDNRGPRNFNNDRRSGPRQAGNAPGGPRGSARRGPQIDLAHDFPALGAH